MKTTDTVYSLIGILIVVILIDFLIVNPKIQQDELSELRGQLTKIPKKFINSSGGKGIIIPANSADYHLVPFTVLCLQKIGNNLPITITVLDDDYPEMFKKLNCKITVLELDFKSEFNLKPLAILASEYSEVIVIEPSVVFLQPPQYLFNLGEYSRTGCLFWKSQKEMFSGLSGKSWIKELFGYSLKGNTILEGTSKEYQDSNVIVIDKSKHLLGLHKLLVLAKNVNCNDREFYWVAFELAKEPYTFLETKQESNWVVNLGESRGVCFKCDPEKLELTKTDYQTPIDYFQNMFGNKKTKNKVLGEREKEILNEYSKINSDLKLVATQLI